MNEWEIVTRSVEYQELFGDYWPYAVIIVTILTRVFPSTQDPEKMNKVHQILHYIFEKTNAK